MAKDWKDRAKTPDIKPTVMEITAEISNGREESIPPDEVTFVPTRDQRKAKAMTYAMAKSRKVQVASLEDAEALNPLCTNLRVWWHNDLFVAWFLNSNTYMQRIDYLIDLQLDNLEEIITNRDGTYSARDQVVAGRQLSEYKKALVDEDKAEKSEIGMDRIKAIAAAMLLAKSEAPKKLRKVDLPDE